MVRYAKRMEQLTNSDIGDLLKLIARQIGRAHV